LRERRETFDEEMERERERERERDKEEREGERERERLPGSSFVSWSCPVGVLELLLLLTPQLLSQLILLHSLHKLRERK
jgi:hypothetical protein